MNFRLPIAIELEGFLFKKGRPFPVPELVGGSDLCVIGAGKWTREFCYYSIEASTFLARNIEELNGMIMRLLDWIPSEFDILWEPTDPNESEDYDPATCPYKLVGRHKAIARAIQHIRGLKTEDDALRLLWRQEGRFCGTHFHVQLLDLDMNTQARVVGALANRAPAISRQLNKIVGRPSLSERLEVAWTGIMEPERAWHWSCIQSWRDLVHAIESLPKMVRETDNHPDGWDVDLNTPGNHQDTWHEKHLYWPARWRNFSPTPHAELRMPDALPPDPDIIFEATRLVDEEVRLAVKGDIDWIPETEWYELLGREVPK